HDNYTVSACNSYIWHGTEYASTGTYTHDYTNADGCLSTDTLHLTISTQDNNTYYVSACDRYYWNGIVYEASGIYTYDHSLPSSSCTNVDTLYLTINYGTYDSQTISVCESFVWNNTTYVTTGTYTFAYTNLDNCPSVDTLHLSINHGDTIIETITACDSLVWHDTTYYATTNAPSYSTTNSVGCDSTALLNLIVNYGTHNRYAVSACDSYIWNGIDYVATGTYTFAYTNSDNCPSTDTLHLTINYEDATIEAITACDSLTWHGTTYYSSTITPTYITTNGYGCDSMVTLNLTVNASYHVQFDTMLCGGFYWEVTDSLYLQSTRQVVHLVTEAGCDSMLTLQLTLYPIDTTLLCDTICRGFSTFWHNMECNQAETYHFDTLNRYGCDSVALLRLNVVDPPVVGIDHSYDCRGRQYHLVAVTTAPYVEWQAEPADSAGLLLSLMDAWACPLTTVAYMVRADWHDTLFCPAYDTLVLQPAQLPTATITTRPEMLTETNLTLYAESQCQNTNRHRWMVNQRWYAENCANITYVANPQDDSVLLELVVENDLCVDTIPHTVPIYHEVLYIPNVIMPESEDASQSRFVVHSEVVTDIEVAIFDRNGVQVFHTTDIQFSWDGTHQGIPCPQGAYLYHIRYRVPSVPNNWKSCIGTITLVR
ncbi:MAG: gliding motility-associated C-terminal domain-containing protein, partial [Bacteroidales bacterium]|nr:gliding motility-associated C-terminal domain-containing protein [Bacteroidales bacterium]